MGFFDFFSKKKQEVPMTEEQKKATSAMQKLAAMGILIAQKKPIVYTKIDFASLDEKTKQDILNSMKKEITHQSKFLTFK